MVVSFARFAREAPATAAIAAAAVVCSLCYWLGAPVRWLFWPRHGEWQWWHLFTCTLFHVNEIHLVFNLTWQLTLGAALERAYGGAFLLGLYAWTAAVSTWVQSIFDGPGIGLSGVVYGLFGYCWLTQRLDPTRCFVRPGEARIFVAWLFIGSFLTRVGLLPIGNTAHLWGGIAGCTAAWLLRRRA